MRARRIGVVTLSYGRASNFAIYVAEADETWRQVRVE